MRNQNFKPLTLDDFGLTPKDLKVIVKGAQANLSPKDEEGEDLPTDVDNRAEPPTSSQND